MYKETLFVGGPIDGKRLVIQQECSYIMFETFKPILSIEDIKTKPETEDGSKRVKYEPLTLKVSSKLSNIMCAEGMTADELIAKLIANYRPLEVLNV